MRDLVHFICKVGILGLQCTQLFRPVIPPGYTAQLSHPVIKPSYPPGYSCFPIWLTSSLIYPMAIFSANEIRTFFFQKCLIYLWWSSFFINEWGALEGKQFFISTYIYNVWKKNHLFLEAFQCMFLELVLEGMMERGREKLCGWKNCPVTSDRGNESEVCIIVLRHNSLISNANSPQ